MSTNLQPKFGPINLVILYMRLQSLEIYHFKESEIICNFKEYSDTRKPLDLYIVMSSCLRQLPLKIGAAEAVSEFKPFLVNYFS